MGDDTTFASFARLSAFVTRSSLSRNEKLVLHAVMASVHWDSWSDRVPAATIIDRSTLRCDAYQQARASLISKGMITAVKGMGEYPLWTVYPEAILRQPVLPVIGSTGDRSHPASIPDQTRHRSRTKPVLRCRTEPVASSVPLDPVPPKIQATEDPSHQEQPPTPFQGDPAVAGVDVPPGARFIDDVNDRATAQHRANQEREASPPIVASSPIKREVKPRQPLTLVLSSKDPPAKPSPARSEAWQNLWDELKPGERDVFADVEAIWSAYVTANPSTLARGPTTKRYRELRSRLKTYSVDALCFVPAGAQLDEWSRKTNQTGRFEWIFQERNIEKFAGYGQNGLPVRVVEPSTFDDDGRMQHGHTDEELWGGRR